jgi:predicted nucleotide-binding protein
MEKTKEYKNTRFSVETLREAAKTIERIVADSRERLGSNIFSVTEKEEKWVYDNEEEFFASYRQAFSSAMYYRISPSFLLNVSASKRSVDVSVRASTRAQIEAVFDVFERHLSESLVARLAANIEKTKEYKNTRFSAEALREAAKAIERIVTDSKEELGSYVFSVTGEEENWVYDNEEEFFASYRQGFSRATYVGRSASFELRVAARKRSAEVSVTALTRAQIEAVFDVFERHLSESRLPELQTEPEPITIFIGHGQSPQWRDLKDHLQDKHGHKIEAYEIGARAGHTIRDILEDMLLKSSFALLVMTGEDETTGGLTLARQNVIHEAGLFQGKLGFSKAIVLLEDGTEEFSNIAGIQQIRFAKGNIKETFGEVLAVLRREFGSG